MWRYIVRRLLQMVLVLVGATLLIFTMVYSLPGDPIRRLSGEKPLPPAVNDALRERYNLDDPFFVQYLKYFTGLFRGDFGETFTGQSVGQIINDSWKITAQLAITAWIYLVVVGMLLGIWAGLRKGKFVDHAVLGTTTVVIAVPTFVLAYVAQLTLGLKLGWFPTSGVDDGWPMSYLLPGMVLGSLHLCYVARLTRTSLAENMRADFVRTAVAKGMTRRRVLVRHTLRNSLVPVVTYLGTQFGEMMVGSIIIEGVFSLPGLGGTVFFAIQDKESAVVVGIVTFFVLAYLVANLIVDLLYAVLDPRIRYD